MVNKCSGDGNKKKVERWIRSEEGWLKVNSDGAFDSTSMIAGTGIIVRNSNGVVADGKNKKRWAASALMAEAMALKDGVDLVIESGGML